MIQTMNFLCPTFHLEVAIQPSNHQAIALEISQFSITNKA
jgi:hypothetical protein